MRSEIKFCAIIFSALLALSMYAEKIDKWSFQYEGQKTPDKKGFARYGKALIADSDKDGIFHFSTIGSDKGAFYYQYVRNKNRVFLNSDVGYTIEFKLKVIKTDVKKNASAIHFDAEDGRGEVKNYWGLNFYAGDKTNYVALSGGGSATPVALNDDFHIYRITVKGENVALYIDGTLACGVKASKKTSTNQFRFGDLTGKADGEFKLDYIRIFTKGAVAP